MITMKACSKRGNHTSRSGDLWYNGGINIVVPESAENTSRRVTNLSRRLVTMASLYSRGQNNKTPMPDTCWICSQTLYHRTWNKTTGLCYWCHSELLNKVIRQKKRARIKGNKATLTTEQWSLTLRLSQGYCYYCHEHIGYKALAMEHRVPLAKGGGTTIENIVPACAFCNGSKGVEVWE